MTTSPKRVRDEPRITFIASFNEVTIVQSVVFDVIVTPQSRDERHAWRSRDQLGGQACALESRFMPKDTSVDFSRAG